MGKLSRTKGHSFEREVAKALRPLFPNAKRHLEFQSDEAALGQDLEKTGNLKIQCKRYKKYAPISCINEVNAAQNDIPVLVTRGDKEKAVACLYLDDFIKILQDVGEAFW